MRGTPFGFSGFHLGLNTIDSPFTLVEGETRECLNVVSTERGAIKKRTGSVLFAAGTGGTFPTLAATDTFKRAAEKPLTNAGKWSILPLLPNTGEINGSEEWQVTGEQSGAFWNVAEQTNPAVSVEVKARPIGFGVSVFACVQTGASLSGYQALLSAEFGGKFGITLNRWKENKATVLAKSTGLTFEAATTLCIAVRAGIVTAWQKTASTTIKLLEAKDTTFTKGFSGFSSGDTETRLNNFTTGEMPAATAELEFTTIVPVKVAAGTFLIATSGKKVFSINGLGEGVEIGESAAAVSQWSIIQFQAGKAETTGSVFLQNGTVAPQTWIGGEEGKEKIKEWKSKAEANFEFGEGKEETIATPKGKFMTVHGVGGAGSRVFIANTSGSAPDGPSTVRCSTINTAQETDPSIWPKKFYAQFDPEDGYEITGLGNVGPYVLVFKPYKCWVIHSVNPFLVRQLSENTGCASQRSIVETPSGTYFLSVDQGVYLTNGSRLTEVSYKVRPTIFAINQAQREKAAGAFFNNHYYLSYPSGTSTTPNRTLDYDVVLKSWWLHDIAGNQWAQWEPTNPGEPFLFTTPAKAKGGVVKAFIPGVFTDNGANYTGENGLGAFWISPWEPFFYFIFRHRIKAPFIKKRIRQLFFDASGELEPYIFRSFNSAREPMAAVVNNNPMSKPEFPVKLTEQEAGFWGDENPWAASAEPWAGVASAARARAYSLGTGTEWSFMFGNNSKEPFEITMVAFMAQFRKS